jgi:serine/threonine protein kinase
MLDVGRRPTGDEPPPAQSVAEAWAQRRNEAIERARRLRALRAENRLGGDHGCGADFMAKLSEAEARDNEAARSAASLPRSVLPKPKRRRRPSTPPDTPSSVQPEKRSRKSDHSQRRAATLQAKVLLQQHMNKKVASQQGSRASVDPARALASFGYNVLAPIATGAFSTILCCRSEASGEVVAVKTFNCVKCASNAEVGEARDAELEVLRLLHEKGLAATCSSEQSELQRAGHPHIANMIAVLGDAQTSAHQHLVLEYASGGSLRKVLSARKADAASGGPFPGMPPQLVYLATRQLASALAHIHSMGVCHRDVKPANILLTQTRPPADESGGACVDGSMAAGAAEQADSHIHVKLCDFGFACLCGDQKLHLWCGTPCYVASEIASATDAHRGYHGRPVDLWALGCVVYEMLHRRPAFHAEERFELESRIRRANHAPIDRRVPRGAKELLRALFVTQPSRRCTAAQMLQEIEVRPW